MRVLIDTNIALDWLAHREPFHETAEAIMQKCMDGERKIFKIPQSRPYLRTNLWN